MLLEIVAEIRTVISVRHMGPTPSKTINAVLDKFQESLEDHKVSKFKFADYDFKIVFSKPNEVQLDHK